MRNPLEIHLERDNLQQVLTIESDSITVGRGQDCEVRIDDPMASRHHCRLERLGNEVFLVDLDSRNGNTRLVAEIIDLFDKPGKGKPERTPEVCQKVAEVLESLLSTWAQQHLSRCRGVEVRIFRLSLDSDGYATSNL